MTILVAEAVELRPGQPLWVQTHDVTDAYVRDDHPNPATPHASHESRAPAIGKIVRKIVADYQRTIGQHVGRAVLSIRGPMNPTRMSTNPEMYIP